MPAAGTRAQPAAVHCDDAGEAATARSCFALAPACRLWPGRLAQEQGAALSFLRNVFVLSLRAAELCRSPPGLALCNGRAPSVGDGAWQGRCLAAPQRVPPPQPALPAPMPACLRLPSPRTRARAERGAGPAAACAAAAVPGELRPMEPLWFSFSAQMKLGG